MFNYFESQESVNEEQVWGIPSQINSLTMLGSFALANPMNK